MSRYIKYPTTEGDIVLMEVEADAAVPQAGVVKAGRVGEAVRDVVEDARTTFEDAMDAVRQNAQAVIDKVKGLSDLPDEVEVTFGLKATGEVGNFAVAKAGAEANYTVTLTWKREEKGKGRKAAKGTSRRPY
jgi:hypothetical protein